MSRMEERNKRSKRRSHSPPRRRQRSYSPPRRQRSRSRDRDRKRPRNDDHSRHRNEDHRHSNEDHRHRNDGHRRTRIKEEVKVKIEPVSPKAEAPAKDKPNFALSGKLAEDTNIYNGIVIKYNEPPDARKPKRRWRLYPFKGDVTLPMLPIHRQSAYLLGRERKVADIPIDHPSCSKQHAALQFRLVKYKREDDTIGQRVRPYIIDLDSANGTFVNNQKIDGRRYVELLEKDVIKFGFSTREYVLLHEESKDEEDDDNVEDADENAAEVPSNADENAAEVPSNADENAAEVPNNADKTPAEVPNDAEENNNMD